MTISEDWQLSKCHFYKLTTSILTQIWANSRGNKFYKKNRRKKLLTVRGVLVKSSNKDNLFLKDFIMVHNCITKRLAPSYSTKHFTDNFTISNRITRNLAYVYLSADCLLISRLSFSEAPKTLHVFPIIMGINCLTTWSQGHLFYYLDF